MRTFRQGKIWVLICTELLSRGIDFKGVNLVINYDFPVSGISYVHRIGRSGRAGKLGRAVTFFTDNDVPDLKRIVNIIKESGCNVPEFMLELKKPKRVEKRKFEKSKKFVKGGKKIGVKNKNKSKPKPAKGKDGVLQKKKIKKVENTKGKKAVKSKKEKIPN